MKKVKSTLKTLSGIYDVAIDGGSVGVHLLNGMCLPINCQLLSYSIIPIDSLISATTSLIQIAAWEDSPPTIGVEIVSSQDSAYFSTVRNSGVVPPNIVPLINIIGIQIVTDALLSGSFKFVIFYIEFS